MINTPTVLPRWTWILPIIGCLALLFAFKIGVSPLIALVFGVILTFMIFAAVHHAEVVAHRTGEPFGTLILALAVTIIEVSLIVSMMLGIPDKESLARDTVFSAVMIICNGIVGLCLFLGGLKHKEQGFHLKGAGAAMSLLTVMAVITLIFPNYAYANPGPWIASRQLAFIAVVILLLYAAFVFVQTVRHRDYFLTPSGHNQEVVHVATPTNQQTLISIVLLFLSLIIVVGLAKALSPTIEWGVSAAGAPPAVVGVIIAAIVLLPEALAAARAARADKLQTSLNLALGSGLASIGLTIPTIAFIFVVLDQPLLLGLNPKDTMMLVLTLFVGAQSLATGHTTILQGIIHLILFAAFLFFAIFP